MIGNQPPPSSPGSGNSGDNGGGPATGGDGGFPPPTDNGSCETPVPPVAPADPCVQKAAISSMAANATIAAQNNTILNSTNTTGIEYGANQNLTSWPGNTYVNTPVTFGSANSWTPGFTWNSTNGYTVGFTHGHPGGTGPSPADVFSIVYPIGNSALTGAGTAAIQYYENNASVTTETNTGNYIVTVNNWTTIQGIYNSSFATSAEVDAFNSSYQTKAGAYLDNNPYATQGDAGAYALMQMFPGAINVYYATPGSTMYKPLVVNGTTLTTTQCP